MLKNLEDLLLKATRNENYNSSLDFVLDLYENDFQPSSLRTQLELLTTAFSPREKKSTPLEVRNYFKSLSRAQQDSMSEVCILLKLLMVMPETNSVGERSASGLRTVKTYYDLPCPKFV